LVIFSEGVLKQALDSAGVLPAIPQWQSARRLEADHGALKRLINPTRGFKSLPTASATIKGFEVMRMICKGQCLMLEPGTTGELRFEYRLFRLAA
jgi:transposase-like protein